MSSGPGDRGYLLAIMLICFTRDIKMPLPNTVLVFPTDFEIQIRNVSPLPIKFLRCKFLRRIFFVLNNLEIMLEQTFVSPNDEN